MVNSAQVHPTAIVDSTAKLEDDVKVGAFAVIRAGVEVGQGTEILEHCVIGGPTLIGAQCQIGPAAYLGMPPQHLRYTDDPANPSYLVIGDKVIIREGARIHRATKPGKENATRVGDRCFLMGATHVAHDCVLENDVIMADAALLGGHCHIEANSFVGGGATLHQFVRVGRYAIISGNEALSQDIPPFAAARYGQLKGYNAVGCRRAGFSRDAIRAIRGAYTCLRRSRLTSEAVAHIELQYGSSREAQEIIEFIKASKRGIVPSRPRSASGAESSNAED